MFIKSSVYSNYLGLGIRKPNYAVVDTHFSGFC